MQPPADSHTPDLDTVRPNEQILYLDFDGVLHHENVLWHPKKGAYLLMGAHHHLFAHVSLLTHLLRPYPNVRIVLSTSWVLRYGYRATSLMLMPSLRDRVIGTTFHSTMNKEEFRSMPRWQQVLQDFGRRRPSAWLVLDDDHEGWPESYLDHYVRTDPAEGLSHSVVLEELQTKLLKIFGPVAPDSSRLAPNVETGS
jgi:hypothetical protein